MTFPTRSTLKQNRYQFYTKTLTSGTAVSLIISRRMARVTCNPHFRQQAAEENCAYSVIKRISPAAHGILYGVIFNRI